MSAQRGFVVTGMGDTQVHGVTIRNTEAKNFAYFYAYAGAGYSDNFVTKYNLYTSASRNTPERLRLGNYFKENVQNNNTKVLYPSGYITDFTFENNLVYLNETMEIGLVIETYSTKQVPENVIMTTSNWYDTASALARENSGNVVRNNTFIAKTNLIHSAMKVAHTSGLLIEGNTFIADGYPESFRTGAAINIAFNNQHTIIRNNYIQFPEITPLHKVESVLRLVFQSMILILASEI